VYGNPRTTRDPFADRLFVAGALPFTLTADIDRPPLVTTQPANWLAEARMEGTGFVLALVGLVVPIALVLGAILFDIAVLLWAAHRPWHDRVVPRVSRAFRPRVTHAGRYGLGHRWPANISPGGSEIPGRTMIVARRHREMGGVDRPAGGAIPIGLMVLRLRLEEGFLCHELPGYAAYATRVRFRLIPGIW
jgi:hypothetical protein